MLKDRSVELLCALPLFSGWDPVSLQAIAYVNTRLFLAPGETLVSAGAEAKGATLIISGTAREKDARGEEAVRQYGPGSLFDEMAMFIPTSSQLNLVAETPLEALRISRERMHDILRNHPVLAAMLAERIQGRLLGIADRLRALNELLHPAGEEDADADEEVEGLSDESGARPVSAGEDRTPRALEHDRRDAPSPAPRR